MRNENTRRTERRLLTCAALPTSVSVMALTLGAPSVLADNVSMATVGNVDFTTNDTHSVTGTGSVQSTGHTDADLILITPDPFTGTFTNDGTVELDGSIGNNAAAVRVDGDLDGSIANNGTIRTNYGASGTSSASAQGIRVTDTVNGTLKNSGRIEIGGTGNASFIHSGGIRTGDVNGSVQNSGVISIIATGGGSSHSATGISTRDIGTGGAVTNSGNILVEIGRDSYIYANGIDGDTNQGRINNSGSITISVNGGSSGDVSGVRMSDNIGQIDNSGTIQISANGAYAYAEGLNVFQQDQTGIINNSGTIRTIAQATSNATATGIRNVFGAGSVTNSGTIRAQASASTSAYAYGYYSVVAPDNGLSFNNSGTISVSASAQTTAEAYGLRIGGLGAGQSFTNSGTIQVNAAGGTVEAFGVYSRFDGGADASFRNSGTITVLADGNGASSVEGNGVYLRGDTSGVIENSGTITLTANQVGTNSHNSVEGLYFGGRLLSGGMLRNSGTINVETFDGSGEAIGVEITGSEAGSLIENTGTINVLARGDEQGATGWSMYNSRGTIIHSGTIVATASDGARDAVGLEWSANSSTARLLITGDILATGGTDDNVALNANGPAGSSVEIVSSATFEGSLRVGGSDVTLRSTKDSATYEFSFLSGNVTTEIGEGGSDWFVLDAGSSTPTYATVASEEIGGNPNVMADAVGLLDVQSAVLGAGGGLAPEVSRGAQGTLGLEDTKTRYFQLQLSTVEGGEDNTANDFSSTLVGLSAGFVGTASSGAELSFGGGLLGASGTSGDTDFDTFGAFLGRTTVSNWNGMRFSKNFGGGLMKTSQTRRSAGSSPASSEFVTAFLSGQVGLEGTNNIGDTPFVPFGSLRYTHFFSSDYTETGGTANATVSARNFGVADLKIGGKMADLAVGEGTLSSSLALVYRKVLGGDQAVSIFGQSGIASITDTDRFGGAISVQYSQSLQEGNLDLGASLETFDGSNSLSATVTYSIIF